MKKGEVFGKVILAGAGPGDPDLITVKTMHYLQQADVVITDRLVSEELLIRYVKPGAEIIYVGKQSGQKKSRPQTEINELLIEQARQHRLVVRLKGGDVSFFSNVLDELRTLKKYQVPYEIIPGVTAASGAAAYAGIPLTARGYATAVRFLAYQSTTELNWKELAATDDTLVFYMASEALGVLVKNLFVHGVNGDKNLAVIEQATTPSQHVHVGTLDEYLKKPNEQAWISPTLIIIGWVAGLHEEFKWINNDIVGSKYFLSVDEAVDNKVKVVC